jgi:hypothetical protein
LISTILCGRGRILHGLRESDKYPRPTSFFECGGGESSLDWELDQPMDIDEPTTAELIESLGNDVRRCHLELIQSIDAGCVEQNGDVRADYEFHARQLVRAIFAFIEAVTFSVKVRAVEHCLEQKRDLSEAERFLAIDLEHELSEKGEIVERRAHIRLAANIRFSFALQEKALGTAEKFDASTAWWSCLRAATKVRDRLTHPKLPGDVDVSGDEITTALSAYEGFCKQVMYYADLRRGKQSV